MQKHIQNNEAVLFFRRSYYYSRKRHFRSFPERIENAKKITITHILNNCQCFNCMDVAYYIHELNFFTK